MSLHPSSEEGKQRLRELHKECPKLFDQSRDAIYITTRKGRYVDVNQTFLDLFGYAKEELLDLREQKIYLNRNDWSRFRQEIEKKGSVRDFPVKLRKKHGTQMDCLLTASLRRAENGAILGYQGIIRDISEQAALLEMWRRYEFIVNTSKQFMTLINREYRYEAVNEAYCLAHSKSRAEILGRTVAEVWGEEGFHTHIKPYLDKCFAGDEVHYQRWFEFNVTGLKRYYDVSYYPYYGNKAELTHAVAITHDITERKQREEEQKRLEAQLQDAQKREAIGTLAGGIAHNFNNLLMAIMGNLSLTLLDTDPTDPHYERLKKIEKVLEKGSKLTKQLLGYAREGRYEVRPLSLNQLVEETADTFGATKKQIRVHQELTKGLFGIKGDPGQIEHALLNLYVNAADAMPAGGDLFLRTMNVTDQDMTGKPYTPKPGDYVLLNVRDTGVGMDEETMKRIFEPFFTTKGLGKGTGLGLSSVYGTVKAHGGYIDVDSKVGRGTSFSIYLPASEKEVAEEKTTPEDMLKGKGTVLLVDDEDMILDVGEGMLKALGYKVLLATGGKDAIEIYGKNKDKIDLVILDMIMPDMSGGETYDRMKQINAQVKVFLSSGYSVDGQATEILARGCDGFIQKPFSIKELSRRVGEILGKE